MPERLVPTDVERSSYFVPAALVVACLGAIGAGIYVYLQSSTLVLSPYRTVLEQLHANTLPADFQKRQGAAQLLDQLRREPCDRAAIIPLAKLMEQAGYPREGARSAQNFGERCGYDDELLEGVYAALTRVGDLAGALSTANRMIELDQARGRYRFLRGTAYEGLKNYKAALSDYISTLQLFTDLSNVASSEFYRISRMYDAIGRPCDAVTPLEMYLSYNVAKRLTQQITQMIKEFANKGSCRATYATGTDRILIPISNIVDVIINGARGRMIVDTGASMVSITPAFAARARILPDETNPMTLQAVGGTVQSAPGYALNACQHISQVKPI